MLKSNLLASLRRTQQRIALLYRLLSRLENRFSFVGHGEIDLSAREGTKAAWIKTLCALASRRDYLTYRLSSEFGVR